MALERTLSIVKPSAVAANHIGAILAKLEAAGLRIVAAKMVHLERAEAESFYGVHRERPFFGELVEFMTSGPIMGAGAGRRERDPGQSRRDGRDEPG